jgi:hypothetical protein
MQGRSHGTRSVPATIGTRRELAATSYHGHARAGFVLVFHG